MDSLRIMVRNSVADGIDPTYLLEQIESVIRERVAQEIDAVADAPSTPDWYLDGLCAAVKIARGSHG